MDMRDHWFTVLRWMLLAVALGDLLALKSGVVSHPHLWLAGLMGAAMLAFGARVLQLIVLRWTAREQGVRLYARIGVAAGVALALAGGLANWSLGLQGYVILTEGETARLYEGSELQGFQAGPLGNVDELGVVVGLDELELVPQSPDAFSPVSRLQVWRGHLEPLKFSIDPHHSGAAGPLRFYQGAFGFAPRIAILRDGETSETLFDKVVPLLTERHGPQGLRFSGAFTVAAHDLRAEGVIRLDSLDDGLRGHATLDLNVTEGGRTLGSGSLLPGHFADLDGGYRVGFTGLHQWSEIVLSRRSYGSVMLAGILLAVCSGVFSVVANRRG
jgi:hypothetical protein